MAQHIQTAMNWGVPYINIWTLYDNECKTFNPTSDSECPGFFMRKPSGAVSQSYLKLRTNFSVAEP